MDHIRTLALENSLTKSTSDKKLYPNRGDLEQDRQVLRVWTKLNKLNLLKNSAQVVELIFAFIIKTK